ncbi:RidA family protein [Microbacteriaceae bacterium VKM Ac-2855]|nr:RidA family protein [Microbacteriaceae bacterium VKM Ac-2855]
MRTLITSGSPWESKMGYSRAVVVGDTIFISASAATGADGQVVSPSLYEQTSHVIRALGTVLTDAGFSLTDVVQSRLSVADSAWADWQEAARAHGEAFGEIRPAFAINHVLPFVDPAILVELELVAIRER